MRATLSLVVSAVVALCVLTGLPSGVGAAAGAKDDGFVNTKMEKRVDLTKHAARVSVSITAKSASGKSKYRFVLPEEEDAHVAFITAKSEGGDRLDVQPASDSPSGFREYTVRLPSAATDAQTFKVSYFLTHSFTPLPKTIPQNGRHFVVHEASAIQPSPYSTEQSSSYFKVGSGEVKSWSQLEPSERNSKKSRIEYGPFTSVGAFETKPVRIHFEHSQPFMTFRMALREVEVSHWGAVSIEEHFELHNTGAELSHGFARVDMQNYAWTGNSFRELTAKLPAGAKDIHFRDIIGNISSSHARPGLDGVTLQVEQRFPLFGGWKTDFYQTYVLPSENHVFVDSKTGEYVLRVPANVPYREPVLDDFTLKVVLPEGATDIVVKPLEVMKLDRRDDTKRFTYLDTVVAGRPVINFHGNNFVSQHAEDLEIRYKVPAFAMLREPLLLSTFFFGLFLAYSIISRVDLSIASKEKSE